MFDGKVGGPRSSATSAKRRDTKASAKDLVEKAKKERENRALMRQRNDAAKSYQTLYRKYITQRKEFDRVRSEFDKKLSGICVFKTALKAQGVNFLPPVATMTELMQQLSFFFRDYADSARMVQLQQLLVDSIASNDANYNVLLNKDSVQRERSEFLVVRMLKCALILLPALCRSGDAEHADLIVRSASAVCRERTNASQAGRWNIRIFDLLALCVGELHQLYGAHPSKLVESTLAKITDLLVHLFQTSMASDLPSRIQCISERIFSIANLQSNALLSRSLQAIALSDVVQHSGDHLLEHFLYAAQAANSWIQRFYCIANFSHLFLSNVSSDTRVLERVRIPWIKAIRTLFQDNLTNTVAMSSSSSTTTAAASATVASSGLFTSKPTSTTSAAKASSALTPHGIPLVLYLCRNTPGFPLLLLESEDHHPSTTGDHHPSAMDIDIPIHEESNDDPAATLRSAWQAQEQEIFTEYLVGDGNRKLEIRISMILNEIARRENKFFVSHQAQVIMDPIEAILKVLTNRDIAAALFGILAESGQSLPTQLSVVAVYAKVLMSYPYKVLDTANTGIGVTQTSKAQATTREALLRTLAFSRPSAPIALLLWQFLWQHFESIVPLLIMSDKKTVISDMRFQQSALTCEMDTETLYQTLIALIYLFCAIFNQQLSATDDQELFSGSFVSTATLIDMTRFLRQWFYKIFWTEPTCDLMSSFLHPQEQMISYTSVLQYSSLMASMRLFHQLCIRHERRPYLADSDYQWPSLPSYEFELVDAETSERYYQVDRDNNILLNATANREGTFFVKNPNLQTVLTCIPQVIPFTQRVALFQSLVDHDKKEYFSALSGRLNIDEMIAGGQIVRISVRRDHMLEDAMTGLHVLGLRMKGRVQVEFISEQGFAEAGIDGGGLFKEFMDDFAQLISDPALGLFETTTDHLLTPNPASAYMIGKLAAPLTKTLETKPNAHKSSSTASASAAAATGIPTSGVITVSFDPRNAGSSSSNPNKRMKAGSLRDRSHLELFEFAGKMLGKALYEKILYQSELAPGFLNVLLGRTNSLDDLYHLDADLYRSLMNLKRFVFQEKGSVDELDLFFDTEWIVQGKRITEELIPQGSQTRVTNANLLIYIYRLANFKQNVKIQELCRAFLKGFRVMIPLEWIRMFNTQELQLLISGDRRRIDLNDMQRHVVYASGYHPSQPYVQAFWQIVAEMSAEDQALLLKFVTSSPRQPLLGFQALNPRFSIQQVSPYSSVPLGSSQIPNEEPRLPTAATCMNLLKLPLYGSIDVLREKLLYAIRSHSGFELS